MSLQDFAGATDLPMSHLESLLAGREPISINVAERLTEHIGGSVAFWLARDAQYQDDLANIEGDAWATQLPFADMVAFGWCRRPADWKANRVSPRSAP
jgi:plasmid maintenance system antidote protein VapI